MLCTYKLNGEEVDSLELKALLITGGVNVLPTVYEQFGKTRRLSAPDDPAACDCLVLPDHTVVHMTNVGSRSPFTVDVAESDRACLEYRGHFLTEVDFPPATAFYEQSTSSGRPFKGMAVLQGLDVLSFQYLWPCDYARAGHACQFCHLGNYTQQLAREGKELPPPPSPRDVAEVVDYAVRRDKAASYVQITGGSSTNPRAEVQRVAEILRAINGLTGLGNIPGEVLVYTSPPADPAVIDDVFAAGADRVACDMEVWDEKLAGRICPGKAKFAGRERFLNTLVHISEKFGPSKACSAFVVGVEPAESFLSAARYLAERGIVPIASIWLPHGRPVEGKTEAPGLDYYRRVLDGLAEIYDTHGCEPPGKTGFNVCLCRDTWNHRAERRRAKHRCDGEASGCA